MKQSKNNNAAPARAASKARVIVGAILGILLLALIGFGVWFVLDRTNNGTEDFRTFTVKLDGKEIKNLNERRSLLRGTHTISADYLLGGKYSYTVDILPAATTKFDYTVNDNRYAWNGDTPLSKAFALKKEENGYTFTVPENLAAVLAALYPNAAIEAPVERELKDHYIYALVITSYNNKTIYTINFSIAVAIEGVETDKPEVQFP